MEKKINIKEADYFYDWQGYYPDDGSLNDGVVKPSGPGAAYVNMPQRCPKCQEGIPAGHMVNTDEYDKLNDNVKRDLSCPSCGHNWPMEYDKLMGDGERWYVQSDTKESRGPHAPKQFQNIAPTIQGQDGKQYITVYRGMSDKEYKRWQHGEMISQGKYFTSMPRKFYVDPNLIKQTDEHTYTFVDNGVLNGEYIVPINPGAFAEFNQPKFTHNQEQFEKGMEIESSYEDESVREKIVRANLKEFPNFYSRISSFKESADPDRFGEVDLQSPPYGGSQPFLNKDMPNPESPASINIQKKQKPDHKPKQIAPMIVDILIEAEDEGI